MNQKNNQQTTLLISTPMSTDESTTLPRLLPTGDICEICGRELYKFKAEFFGVTRQFSVTCKCKGEARKEKEMQETLRKKREYLDRLFRQSRLGERFRNASFENYLTNDDTKFIYGSLKQYTDNFTENKKKSILLYGPPGTGKTMLAGAVVNSLLKRGILAIFISVPDLFSQIMACYNNNSQMTEEKLFNGLTDCDLLVLDEIGLRKPKDRDDWAAEKLYQIINSRYSNMKATIFTTNCNLNELSDRLGFRTFARILEMSMNMTFDFSKSKDWRMIHVFNSNK